MFLESTIRNNRKLIQTAVEFHQNGIIPPNTYLVDLDTVANNTKHLSRKAKKLDIELFFMTKQFGRNPIIANTIVENGIEKAVAVDPWEAISLNMNGIKIGHVGHLVQIPINMIQTILDLNPDYITVFSYENAKNISRIAKRMGRKQKIFLRIANGGDFIYKGQEGGFSLDQLKLNIDNLEKLEGVEIAGLTSFPCILIKDNKPSITNNVLSMIQAKTFLMNRGYHHLEMNMPSATSCCTMELLKENGATQGEPGHALTGSTPLHATKNLEETPAMIYVTEVSHIYNQNAYVFGGGFYPRSHMKYALVGNDKHNLKKVSVIENDPTNIDYYGTLATDDVKIGDTVIYSFRTQVFVTKAKIAVVKDVATIPKLLGIFDSMGNLINE